MSSRSNTRSSTAPAQPSSKPLKCRQILSKDIIFDELANEFKIKGEDGKSSNKSAKQYNSFISHKTKGNKLYFLVNEIKIDAHGMPTMTYVNEFCKGFLDYLKVPLDAKSSVKPEEEVYETSKADLKHALTQFDNAAQDKNNINKMFGKTTISLAERKTMEYLSSVKIPEPSDKVKADPEKLAKFEKYGAGEFAKFKFMTKEGKNGTEYTTEFYVRDPSITDKKNPNYRTRRYPKDSEELIDMVPFGSVVQLLVHAQNIWTPTAMKKVGKVLETRTYGITYKIHGMEITPASKSQSPSEQFKNFNWGDDDSDEDLEATNDENTNDDAEADADVDADANADADADDADDNDNASDNDGNDDENDGEDYQSDPEEAESPVASPEPPKKKVPVKVIKPAVTRGGKKN